MLVLDEQKLIAFLKKRDILIEVDDAGVAVRKKKVVMGSKDYERVVTDEEFERFWKAYPRTAGKQNAAKAWVDVAEDRPPIDELMAGLERYVKHLKQEGTPVKYIKHASTWLHGFHWEDRFDTFATSVGQDGKIRIYREIEREEKEFGSHPRWEKYKTMVVRGQIRPGFREFLNEGH